MPRPKKPRPLPPVPVQRFVITLPGVNTVSIKHDLARLGLLRRTGVQNRWRVRKATAKLLFEERLWEQSGKMDIFPTEAGKAKLRELYEAGELTLKMGFKPAEAAADPADNNCHGSDQRAG